MPAKGHVGRHVKVRVDPNAARAELPRHLLSLGHVLAPDGRSQARGQAVGAAQHLFLGRPLEQRHDGAKGLLGHDARVVGRVVDNLGLDQVALAFDDLTGQGDVVAALVDVAVQGLDELEPEKVLAHHHGNSATVTK